ncbi:RHS repeat domain-containing protein, partial [Pseudomarimonas arenosa]
YPNGTNNDQINDSMAPNTFPFADDRYTYDLLGNRLTDQRQTPGETWQYNPNNELLHSGFATYQYNENGSTTAKQDPSTGQSIQSYAYNSEERMSEVRDGEGNLVAEYYYDPFGRRLWAKGLDRADKTAYLMSDEGYAGSVDLGGETVGSVELIVFPPDSAWASDPILTTHVESSTGQRTVVYMFNEGRGATGASLVSGGSIVRSQRASFGESSHLITRELKFPGQVHDERAKLTYNWHRWYDSTIGRYISVDPKMLKGSLNLFSFAASNPMSYSDPDGRLAITPSCKKFSRAIEFADLLMRLQLTRCRDRSCGDCKESQTCKQITEFFEAIVKASDTTQVKCVDSSIYQADDYVTGTSDGRGGNVSHACGWMRGSGNMTLTPSGLNQNSGCGCLQSTIFHELTHSILNMPAAQGAEDSPFSPEHQVIYPWEDTCFDCSSVTRDYYTIPESIPTMEPISVSSGG